MAVIKDIARQIASVHQLKSADAEYFVQMMVEVIHEGLLSDRQVKIKGLGTFRLQSVKERSSVNVNTGERVIISEHDRVTFTPENTMRDIINKPFLQFETVVVEEESLLINVEDEADKEEIEEEYPISKEATIAKVSVPVEEVKQESNIKEESPVEENQVEEEEKPQEITQVEQQKEELEEPEEQEEEAIDCERQLPKCRSLFIYYAVVINVIVAVIAFAIGYFAATHGWFDAAQEAEKPAKNISNSIVVVNKPAVTKASTIKAEAKNADEKAVEKPVTSTETSLHAYDNDARVRTGAYYIVGTSEEIVVREGQTISSISKAYLGSGMECYIEAYNGTKTVKAGDKIKIPRLKLKKRLVK